MRKLTLDSNEYISALAFGGKAARLLHMAIDRDLEIGISRPIITEVLRILREKFDWPGYDIHAAKRWIEKTATVVEPSETLDIVAHDPPDNRVSGVRCRGGFGVHYHRGPRSVPVEASRHGKNR